MESKEIAGREGEVPTPKSEFAMRQGILGLIAALLVSSGSVLAQPAPADPNMSPMPPVWGVNNGLDHGPDHGLMDRGLDNGAPPQDGGCYGCGPFWFRAEWLLWQMKDQPLPVPLVTAGSAANFGVVGASDTVVLFGDSNQYMHHFNGGRISGGFWFCPQPAIGVELSAFTFEKEVRPFSVSSDSMGNPVIARPFFDAVNQAENVALVSFPGAFAGVVNAFTASKFYGSEVNAVWGVAPRSWWSAQLIGGFRYVELDEQLQINSLSVILPSGFIFFNGNTVGSPNGIAIQDNFDTRNQFYGGQIGGRVEMHWGRLSLELMEKFGIGGVSQVVGINGQSTLLQPSQTALGPGGPLSNTFPSLFPPTVTVFSGRTGIAGGVLATETNSGQHTTTKFGVLSDSSVNLRFRLTKCLSIYGGYEFLFLNKIVRPGTEVDRTVNQAGIPTSANFSTFVVFPARPTFSFNEGTWWAHGGNIGLQIDF
jgi:hypothetical protein